MKYVRVPNLDIDREAIRARLKCAIRESETEAQITALCDIPALLATLDELRYIEEANRREFADLLAAARTALTDLDERQATSVVMLHALVNLHRDITAEELDAWRPWSQSTEATPVNTNHDPDRKEALTN